MTVDPFSTRTEVPSEFASVASFRGRLILIEPTGFEYDVPSLEDPSKKSDRITATVTVIDGSETSRPVEIMPRGNPSGQFLPGNKFEGVWISQDRLVKQIRTEPNARGTMQKMVLGKLETYKPGKHAAKGNPWGLDYVVTEADKDVARSFLQRRYAEQASAAVGAAAPAAAANPFAKGGTPASMPSEAPF